MSLEILNQLETKIQQTVTTIQSLQREIDELKQKNQDLETLISEESDEVTNLRNQNMALQQEQTAWQERISTLVSKIGEISR
ncbi:cell division protein ZapB [Orbus hercynius]|uniref:Cell division protein ZapB n=1 Tax=Orbus hercynius TaxID=593135 RepID=A0A495RII7_9GAMM|nr:cell division protein ZapB [Orbus hercynius]RKS87235.1 cell division protein ZapB [Orbus hercynius]